MLYVHFSLASSRHSNFLSFGQNFLPFYVYIYFIFLYCVNKLHSFWTSCVSLVNKADGQPVGHWLSCLVSVSDWFIPVVKYFSYVCILACSVNLCFWKKPCSLGFSKTKECKKKKITSKLKTHIPTSIKPIIQSNYLLMACSNSCNFRYSTKR